MSTESKQLESPAGDLTAAETSPQSSAGDLTAAETSPQSSAGDLTAAETSPLQASTDVANESVVSAQAAVSVATGREDEVVTQTEVLTQTYEGPDRRESESRRDPMGFFSLRQVSLHRERKSPGRRSEDWEAPYVDWYERRYMLLVVAIALLVVVDSYFSLVLWDHGLIQLSPLMTSIIEDDVRGFVIIKFAVTSLALVLMVLYKNFSFYKYFRVGNLLYGLLAVYAVIVFNQFWVWSNLH